MRQTKLNETFWSAALESFKELVGPSCDAICDAMKTTLATPEASTAAVAATGMVAAGVAAPLVPATVLFVGTMLLGSYRARAAKAELDEILSSYAEPIEDKQDEIIGRLTALVSNQFDQHKQLEELDARIKSTLEVLAGMQAVNQSNADNQDKIIALLEKHEGVFISLQAFMLDNLAELKDHLDERFDLVEQLLRGAPPLVLTPPMRGLDRSSGASRRAEDFVFSNRLHRFIGRHRERESLESFCQADHRFAWRAVVGPAGVGKSRLALELAVGLGDAWHAGFLPAGSLSELCEWKLWRPTRPTLIIVDYARGRAKYCGEMIEHLAGLAKKKELKHDVRVLLLERDARPDDASGTDWYLQVLAGASTYAERLRRPIDDPLRLGPPDFENEDEAKVWVELLMMVWKLAQAPEISDLDEFNKLTWILTNIDPYLRPLTVIMAAQLAAEQGSNEAITGQGPADLARAFVERERDRYWNKGNIDQPHRRLFALASILGGLHLRDTAHRAMLDELVHSAGVPDPGALGAQAPFKPTMYQFMEPSWRSGQPMLGLQPDLLGEAMLVHGIGLDQHEMVIEKLMPTVLCHSPREAVEFLVRCLRDFGVDSDPLWRATELALDAVTPDAQMYWAMVQMERVSLLSVDKRFDSAIEVYKSLVGFVDAHGSDSNAHELRLARAKAAVNLVNILGEAGSSADGDASR
ncbi:MAG: hypothetical protein ACF8K1_08940, partial [Phycisphaerales bacterium JB047]